MKTVKHIETMDGKLHATLADAKRHAEAVYGLALSRLAGELVKVDKYVAMHEAIETRLEEFLKLAALKADIECEDDGSDDD